jgi:hypothetical protein
VVDGSTDGTAAALVKLECPFPLSIIEQENSGGAPGARGRGAARPRLCGGMLGGGVGGWSVGGAAAGAGGGAGGGCGPAAAAPSAGADAATQSHELIPDNYALLTTSEARGKNASAASMVHRAPCTPRPVQRYVERLRTGWVAEWFKANRRR